MFFSNYYSVEKIMNFLTTSKKYSTSMKYTFFILLSHSRQHCSEVMALTWNDIDFQKGFINVNKAAAYSTEKKVHIKSTKNNTHRKVHINSETLAELKKMERITNAIIKNEKSIYEK